MVAHIQKSILLVTLVLSCSVNAEARSSIDQGIDRLVDQLSQIFDQESREKSLFVGGFHHQDGNGDADFRNRLITSLEAHGFTIRRAQLQIEGRFLKGFQKGESHEEVNLQLKVTVRDRSSDEEIAKISIPVFGEEAIEHLNPIADLPAELPEQQRQQILNQAIDNPSVAFERNIVRPSADSQFGVEILVGRDNRLESVRPTDDLGFAFVPLQQGDEYVVRLHNDADFEAAVSLRIDGLSMDEFSEAGKFGGQVLVPPRQSIEVPGWFINTTQTDAFEIMAYAKSAAAIRNAPMAGVGTITATFHAAWDPSSVPPPDESSPKSADQATGRGRRIGKQYQVVQRVVGKQRALITVRYSR